ncbi:T9SS type B sorting domain-containing protein [Flavobacterium nackdongense]|uniref:Gliding motility-associated C-terminal domain-containing protein n=1 Tax=Flavobacterium nackdongense TaxID=2547394 RepID=A0A4P6YEK2_9FLAO|nr:gliding motility-associated C-terminal domain-containing protein [Flavobacterium nackdongense]QBN19225.1 gliding motility-associated C-terminal domain-containing protein [Flavobacterium nackdongense]
MNRFLPKHVGVRTDFAIKMVCAIAIVFIGKNEVFSQTIIPEKLPFTKICSQANFNSFEATFKYSGFPASTTFSVELSDDKGSFSAPIATTTIATADVSASEKTITFAVPTTIKGSETYKLRVKSATGIYSGDFYSFDQKTSFPVYFKKFSQPFYINNQMPNLSLCNGGSVNLSIDNPTPSNPSSSPANFSELKYNWYKNNVLIPGQTGNSLNVNALGLYYAEINYGSCTDVNIRSQEVTVSGTAGNVSAITSSLSNPFCPSAGATTLTATAGNTYVWKKDNVVIPGANAQTYQTNSAGKYSVDVDFGGCKSTATIDLQVNTISSSINVPEISSISEGGTKNVIVTTTALNPVYKWYANGLLIPGATSNSYTVTNTGAYKVSITQNSGCIITDEIAFTVNSIVDTNAVEIPNLISPNNDGVNDVWSIPQAYLSGTNTEILIMNSYGDIVFQTNNYLNNWPESDITFKNINPVFYYIITTSDGKLKKGSITIVK